MAAQERTENAAGRVGTGVGQALHRAYPASPGEEIARVYPPDEACDERFDALIERMQQIPWKKKGVAGDGGSGAAAQRREG